MNGLNQIEEVDLIYYLRTLNNHYSMLGYAKQKYHVLSKSILNHHQNS